MFWLSAYDWICLSDTDKQKLADKHTKELRSRTTLRALLNKMKKEKSND